MSLWKHQRCSESKILYDWQAIELCVSLCELGGWFAAELCLCEHCVCLWAVLPIVLSGFRLTRCRAPLWLHLCNVCPSVTCVKCVLVAQVVEPRLQCRVLVVGWRAAELLLCVMWNVCSCACVELRLQSTDGYVQCRLARCRAPFWLHLCNVMCVLVCLCAHVLVCYCACTCSVWNSDCSAAHWWVRAGWRAAELLCRERSVSWGPAGTNQAPATLPPPAGWTYCNNLCRTFSRAGLSFNWGVTEEASNPSVLGEEGSDFEAHGELNLPL